MGSISEESLGRISEEEESIGRQIFGGDRLAVVIIPPGAVRILIWGKDTHEKKSKKKNRLRKIRCRERFLR